MLGRIMGRITLRIVCSLPHPSISAVSSRETGIASKALESMKVHIGITKVVYARTRDSGDSSSPRFFIVM